MMPYINRRAIDIGNAGEHLVIADIIIEGHAAYQASQGSPYDVVADVDGKLLRFAVKSTMGVQQRPEREGGRICYVFSVGRARRDHTGRTDARGYTEAECDIVSFVALDTRKIAYCHIRECARSMHFDPPGASHSPSRRGLFHARGRKTFEFYGLKRALEIQAGVIDPIILKGRQTDA